MATPHVAGLAGLLASQGLTAAQIRDRICSTAAKISGTGTLWTCGRIDAAAAVGGAAAAAAAAATTAGHQRSSTAASSPAPRRGCRARSGGYALITTTRPHTGTYGAYLGGYNNATDSICQTVTVPANGMLSTGGT